VSAIDRILDDVEWVALDPPMCPAEDVEGIPYATHRGVLRLTLMVLVVEVECFRLSDGRRVISEEGMTALMGTRLGGGQ
jgi:hypothetical protein